MIVSSLRRPRGVAAALATACLTVALAATASAALSSIGTADVGFLAVGPGGLKIEGTGNQLAVTEQGEAVTVSVPLGGLKTGISLRDDHMKKALNVGAHPKATLRVERSGLKFPEDKKSAEGSASGKFTLNGVTQDVKFDYKAARTGTDYHVQGRTEINMTSFKLEQPCYLGVCVDKNVKVKVKFKVRDK